MLLGIAISAILVARIFWRASAGRRFTPEPGPLGRPAIATNCNPYQPIYADGRNRASLPSQ
jgi:hypothetical protein